MYRFDDELLKSGRMSGQRRAALEVLAAALEAADPGKAVKRFLQLQGDLLLVADRKYDLRGFDRVLVVGAGKAGSSMASAVEEVLGDRVAGGIVNVKYGHVAPTKRVRIHEAGHPMPDEQGLEGTREMVDLLEGAGPRDLVITVISGGGSALMDLPVDGITLNHMKALTDALLRSGATINEINTIRKHLSQVKGGGLARIASPARVVSLILSDVVGNPLDFIASGPTVPDSTTFQDAWRVLEQYGLTEAVPEPIAVRLRAGVRGEIPDTLKEGDPVFERVQNVVVASNELAAEAAVAKARELGFNTLLLSTFVEGEARELAKMYAAIAREMVVYGRPLARPACVIAGGETTVTVRGNGKGGRNQEMALAAAIKIAGLQDVMIVPAATDGTDGPTDATGAIADGTTVARALAAGMDPAQYLANNDAYHFFERLGDLIKTGPTNTNVNDLTFVYLF
ncbi:MAG: glycerate kinase type-2 family protein [Sphingomonadaceae bacterium]